MIRSVSTRKEIACYVEHVEPLYVARAIVRLQRDLVGEESPWYSSALQVLENIQNGSRFEMWQMMSVPYQGEQYVLTYRIRPNNIRVSAKSANTNSTIPLYDTVKRLDGLIMEEERREWPVASPFKAAVNE